MWPKTIEEVIEALDSNIITEGVHVEFKIFHSSMNVDSFVRTMIGLANSGGGVVIIGIDLMGMHIPDAMIVDGVDNMVKNQLCNDIHPYIERRVKNMDDWNCDFGTYQDIEFAAVFVRQSSKGMSYLYSENDPMNRTYYYRSGGKSETLRAQYRTVYKYMTMDAMIASLEGKCCRFCEPISWPDKYESRFYCADYSKIDKDEYSEQRLYVTCVTRTQNNEAAWKVYAGREGLQAHCVQLELDMYALLEQLFNSGYKIFERRVHYENDNYIQHLHEKSNKNYNEHFIKFNFNQFLNLMALKREAFAYENEIRLFALKQVAEERSIKKAFHEDLPLDWSKVIKKLRIDSKCTVSELVALRHSCWARGINPVIKGKELPGDVPANVANMVQMDVTLFNIDDMPGKRRIVIEA